MGLPGLQSRCGHSWSYLEVLGELAVTLLTRGHQIDPLFCQRFYKLCLADALTMNRLYVLEYLNMVRYSFLGTLGFICLHLTENFRTSVLSESPVSFVSTWVVLGLDWSRGIHPGAR